MEQGLSQISALCLHQDELERIWIGTGNGLNCWDGVHMKTFFPIKMDTSSLMEHGVLSLTPQKNYLWIRAKSGLSRLNIETLKFERYYLGNTICAEIFNDTLLCSTSKGLVFFDETNNKFQIKEGILAGLSNITVLYRDSKDVLWIGLREGIVYKYEKENNSLTKIPIFNTSEISTIYCDHLGEIWIGTKENGVFIYNQLSQINIHISNNTNPLNFNNSSIRAIVEDNSNRIWVGTYTGLYMINKDRNSALLISSSDNNPNELSHNSIFSLLIDKQGSLWVGTYFGGVNYSNIEDYPIIYYNNSSKDLRPSHRVIGQMIEDEKNNIWIATEGGGLDFYDRQNNTFKIYQKTDDAYGLSQRNVKSLYLKKDEMLLIGTYLGGLNVMNLKTQRITRYIPAEYKSYAPSTVWSIIPFENKYLLGTTEGIVLFDHENEKFSKFFTNKEHFEKIGQSINNLLIDSRGVLWIASQNNGLFSYDMDDKILKQYTNDEFDITTVGSNSIHQIYEDHQLRLWIATKGGGLSLYNRDNDNFTTFTKDQHNLPSDFIYSIVESRFGNLWISTSKGLSRFDVEKRQFYNYDFGSGFPLQELNYSSLMLSRDGELFIGGIDGLISLYESDLISTKGNINLFFSTLTVNNKEVEARDFTDILKKDIAFTKTIKLKPKQNVFSIGYAANNYTTIPKNKYQYQLEGFNEDWINAEYATSVTYTNLSPGTYTFKVRGTNSIYLPITEVIELEIIIVPPFYRSWIAYLIYAITFIILLFLFNYSIIGRMRLADQLKIENLDKARLKELNQSKLRFFTNIAHEFITPLTLIIGSIQNVLENFQTPPTVKNKLSSSYKNAIRLKELSKELLEFRKLEQGYTKLRVQEYNIVPFLKDIFNVFNEIAYERKISYSFISEQDSILLWYDPYQMEKVFFNVLSNAFKYVSDKEGIIKFTITDQPEYVEIKISDNGKGIPSHEVGKIFNRFFQIEDEPDQIPGQGTGIGLALSESIVKAHQGDIYCRSELNLGSDFIVCLKKGSNHIDSKHLGDEKRDYLLKPNEGLIKFVGDTKSEEENTKLDKESPLILIIEDNFEMLSLISDLFRGIYNIETAIDGEEGLEKALKIQPDIIISDVIMPKLSGLELCRKLKRNINTSHIPVILLSALSSEENRIQALETGADEYISKPFNSRLLKVKVENLFYTREMLQANYRYDPDQKLKNITHSPIDQNFMEKSQKIITEHLTDSNFSVDSFAQEMGLSRSLFFKKIKSISGNTPNDLIQTIRLKKAAELLLNESHKNISEIAYEVGFSSSRYFTQCFKNHFGVTPSKYGKREDEHH